MRRYLDDEKINIARGLVAKTVGVHTHGATQAMSIGATGTVWDFDDREYPWSALASANTVNFVVSNSSDVGHQITVEGLDENKNAIQETVTLSAQTGISTTNTFTRVNTAYFSNGVAIQNIGNITVMNGASTAVARIMAGAGKTQMAVYSVPSGHTAYMMRGACSVQSGADGTGYMFIRQDGDANFRIGHSFEVSGGGPYQYTFAVPFPITANSDIDVRATVRSNNARVTAVFDLILLDNR